jgi:hypothetical protein
MALFNGSSEEWDGMMQFATGLLLATIFGGIMAAQPLVKIQSNFPEFELNGLKLVPIDTAEHAGEVKKILADDAAMLAPLLPYSVILVNASGRRLLGVGVDYHWIDSSGQSGGQQMMLTALSKGSEKSIIPHPGIKLFTPSEAANRYLSVPPPIERLCLPRQVWCFPSVS